MMNKKFRFLGFLLLVLIIGLYISSVMGASASFLVWEDRVPSTGEEVQSPLLEHGVKYRIVAKEIFWYDKENNLTADAQYYTTDPDNQWIWTNHFSPLGGHSFLQINGINVNWGPFSNGEIIGDPSIPENYFGHTYEIYYIGQGTALKFRIVDWVDGNYENNECNILVQIYRDYPVGGIIIDSDSFDSYTLMKIGLLIGCIFTSVLILERYKK